LPPGASIAGYRWNGYRQRVQRSGSPLWTNTPSAFAKLSSETGKTFCLLAALLPRDKALRALALAYALPKAKNACCGAHPDLLDTLLEAIVMLL